MVGSASTESDIQKKSIALVWKLFNIRGHKLNIDKQNGYPDLIFWVPGGSPVLIEMKAPGKNPRPLQCYVHKKLKSKGYTVATCDSTESVVIEMIKFLQKKKMKPSQRQYLLGLQQHYAPKT